MKEQRKEDVFIMEYLTNIAKDQDNIFLSSTMTGNIQSRQTELAILESVGMTEKQMRRMLIIEGLLFAGISLFLTATIGTAVTYYLYQSMNYRGVPFMIPVFPVFIMAVIVVVVCVAVPLIVERLIGRKKSVVERIRTVE